MIHFLLKLITWIVRLFLEFKINDPIDSENDNPALTEKVRKEIQKKIQKRQALLHKNAYTLPRKDNSSLGHTHKSLKKDNFPISKKVILQQAQSVACASPLASHIYTDPSSTIGLNELLRQKRIDQVRANFNAAALIQAIIGPPRSRYSYFYQKQY